MNVSSGTGPPGSSAEKVTELLCVCVCVCACVIID